MYTPMTMWTIHKKKTRTARSDRRAPWGLQIVFESEMAHGGGRPRWCAQGR